MEARLLHYLARDLLLVAPTASSPSPVLEAAVPVPGVPGDRQLAAEHDGGALAVSFNNHAIALLALLICGLVAAVALHVVLQCALRVKRRACYYGAPDAGALQEPTSAAAGAAGGAGGRARQGGGGGGRKRVAPLLPTTIPCVVYKVGLELAGSSPSLCAICLAEFAHGEQVRVLPRCNHGFHPRCIDRWLRAHPTCPTCRQSPFPAEPVAPDLQGAETAAATVAAVVQVIVITSQL